MNIQALQGAKSFSVTEHKGPLSAQERQALEHNGKVDLVVQDGEQTVVLSGEKIDIQEYNQKMGQALPNYETDLFGVNRDLTPLQNMDVNHDGSLTEDETHYGMGEALSEGLDTAGKTISGMSEVGGLFGMAYGTKVHPSVGYAGGVVGMALGGLAGVVAAPFKAVGEAYNTQGKHKDVHTWGFTLNLQDIR